MTLHLYILIYFNLVCADCDSYTLFVLIWFFVCCFLLLVVVVVGFFCWLVGFLVW